MNTCKVCGTPIAQNTGRGRKREYCSDACKQAEYRANFGLPPEMMMADRWVRWRYERRGQNVTKIPITLDGTNASSIDPRTWSDYVSVSESTVGDGYGFCLGDGFACIDLDHCYNKSRKLLPWAKMILAPVQGATYVEISPSGDGLHIWGRVSHDITGVKVRELMNVEAYTQGRYITVTRRVWRKAPAKLANLDYLCEVISHLA